jgi:hypothetical protein
VHPPEKEEQLRTDEELLVKALDAGGDLDAAETRRRDGTYIESLTRRGFFAYVAEAGKPSVFRLTEQGRGEAMKVATG